MTKSILDFIKKEYPAEIENGFITESPMTWDEAIDLFKASRGQEIFTAFDCPDTAFRDEIFEGMAAYLGKTWKDFAAWANEVQDAFEFNA